MLTVAYVSSPIVEKTGHLTSIVLTQNVLEPELHTAANLKEIARGLELYRMKVEKEGRPASVRCIARAQPGERKPRGFDAWQLAHRLEVCLDKLEAKA
ncbi:MAG: hypothetical protein AAF566_13745 [Pseudomonadota bacterium]